MIFRLLQGAELIILINYQAMYLVPRNRILHVPVRTNTDVELVKSV